MNALEALGRAEARGKVTYHSSALEPPGHVSFDTGRPSPDAVTEGGTCPWPSGWELPGPSSRPPGPAGGGGGLRFSWGPLLAEGDASDPRGAQARVARASVTSVTGRNRTRTGERGAALGATRAPLFGICPPPIDPVPRQGCARRIFRPSEAASLEQRYLGHTLALTFVLGLPGGSKARPRRRRAAQKPDGIGAAPYNNR